MNQGITNRSETDRLLRRALVTALALDPARVDGFELDTPLFGALPELDSMAVATLLTEMEDRLGITVDDDDIDADVFETYGSLLAYAAARRAEAA